MRVSDELRKAAFYAISTYTFCRDTHSSFFWTPFARRSVEWYPNPIDNDAYDDDIQVMLRFQIGNLVQCRVGADPVTGWANGQVIELFYRESNWPPGQVAPYKILLDDGRKIFAPQDTPEVIRARPTPAGGG